MFYEIRYQTGELDKVVSDMLQSKIPCMDVDNIDEFEWVISELKKKGILKADEIPYDKNARDPIKEPEFEFRAAFKDTNNKSSYLYIDFYFEPFEDRDYDPIFGD